MERNEINPVPRNATPVRSDRSRKTCPKATDINPWYGVKIGIIGGGIQGLSLAYFLSQKGYKITVFEKESILGGEAGCFKTKGDYLENFYHHMFKGDAEILALIKELGLEDNIISKTTLTSVLCNGKIYPFSSPLHILRFTPLPIWDRVRFGLSILLLRRIKNWRKLAPIPAAQWLQRYAGRTAYQKVWEPLLKGKFGPDADRVSMAWFWYRVVTRGGSRSKGSGQEELVYLRGGLDQIYERLKEEIEKSGGKVLYPAEVTKVEKKDRLLKDGPFQIYTNGKTYQFDKVVFATATAILANTFKDLPEGYIKQLGGIQYRGVVVAVLSLKKSLLGETYWLNVNDPGFPFIAVVEHTNFISKENYGGEILVYIGTYPATDDPLMKMKDEEVVKKFTEPLKNINPDFDSSWINRSWVLKDLYAQPITTIDYQDRLLDYKTPIEGLYLVNHSQIYPGDRQLDQAIIQSKKVVGIIL